MDTLLPSSEDRAQEHPIREFGVDPHHPVHRAVHRDPVIGAQVRIVRQRDPVVCRHRFAVDHRLDAAYVTAARHHHPARHVLRDQRPHAGLFAIAARRARLPLDRAALG